MPSVLGKDSVSMNGPTDTFLFMFHFTAISFWTYVGDKVVKDK